MAPAGEATASRANTTLYLVHACILMQLCGGLLLAWAPGADGDSKQKGKSPGGVELVKAALGSTAVFRTGPASGLGPPLVQQTTWGQSLQGQKMHVPEAQRADNKGIRGVLLSPSIAISVCNSVPTVSYSRTYLPSLQNSIRYPPGYKCPRSQTPQVNAHVDLPPSLWGLHIWDYDR